MADITKEDVIEFIANMTVLDLSELVKEMEEKFGVSAAAPVAMMAAGAGDAGAAQEEEQTEFDVILIACGDKKIAVIGGGLKINLSRPDPRFHPLMTGRISDSHRHKKISHHSSPLEAGHKASLRRSPPSFAQDQRSRRRTDLRPDPVHSAGRWHSFF